MTTLITPRLRLEPMTDAHLHGLFEMNKDPEVMRYITGKPDTLEDTQSMIDRVKARWAEWGYSWWTFVERNGGLIVGAGCVQHIGRDRANPHELGWRLRRDRWDRGYASEAARRMAAFAFDELRAPQLVAFCDQDNTGSAHVMQKLGMSFRGIEHWYDFDGALYGMTAAEWRAWPASAQAAAEIAACADQSPPTK
ncbi:GNAT family N-acetyltransferase [Mitsuaria sp. GD03876]|uniref:GNAT family N-acetyltransferase n=1 Tax=Mitsuaria sp. GD03876 TaxID=2975399 RepID=UPI00244BE793|nr:GNAT family N-acetyltransferase [Mitsuaria sp. GD03876]MDH0867132.1 GNAT family N-acetyltransferase [Mitsuaria sp. GD03876]